MQRLDVAGTYNFREPAGYAADGGRIRAGVLYRSDGLFRLGETGRRHLIERGVARVIDLREAGEVSGMPDDLADAPIEYCHLPIDTSSALAPGGAFDRLAYVYERMFTEHGAQIVAAVRLILSSPGATVVHCTAGKDRTGSVIAIALLAVGVDRATVLADFAASEAHLTGEWLDHMVGRLAEWGVPDSADLRTVLGGSPQAVFDHALEQMMAVHGGAREFLLTHGLSLAELAALQHTLVEPE